MPTITSPYITPGNKKKYTAPTNTSYGAKPTGVSSTVAGTSLPWYMNPSANARPDTQYNWQGVLDQTRTLSPAEQAAIQMQVRTGSAGATTPQNPYLGRTGSGGRGGGGGGGGAAGEAGLDQATLDWLFAQMGRGRPQDLTYNPLDLPDPSKFFGQFDTSLYDQAGQGVNTGIEAMRARGNTAFDNALAEAGRYTNPYAGGMQTVNPDHMAAMQRMAAANDAMGQLQQTVGEGAQADRAFGNVYALMAANDEARQAANLRAINADRQMMDTNLGLEGNMLNLGVNMARAKGKSAWDQMLAQLGFDTATQEASANWQRQNTVGDTNVGNRNAWNSGLMQTLLSIVGAKAPSATLPADVGGFYV